MSFMVDVAYWGAGLIASPWLGYKALTDRRYRHRLRERLGFVSPTGGGRTLWVHAASLGEVHLVRPLVGHLAGAHPDVGLYVSTLTLAGRKAAEQAFPGARVAYFPLDLTGAVRRTLARVRPAGVILVELEVWPNFVEECARRGVPVAVVNGRMSHRSFERYRRLDWFFRRSFRRLAGVGVQNQTHAARLGALGARPVVTGNLKFNVQIGFDPAAEERTWRERLSLGDAPVLVAGSTHEPEEGILVETYKRLQATFPRLRLVLAPRHLERVRDVEKVIEAADLRCYKRTQSSPGEAAGGVVVLDTVGELDRVYTVATAAFVGGTFAPRGGQNMLEPAALGKPIVSGPNLSNFEDVVRALVSAGGMKVVDNPVDLALTLGELLRHPEVARAAGARAREAVRAGEGALEATTRFVEANLLKGR